MKILYLSKFIIILLTMLSFSSATAFAYYDPGLQRWINRDPIGEKADCNLYEHVANSSINYIDSFGLDIWACIHKTTLYGIVSTHAFFWDDRPGAYPHSCGRDQSNWDPIGTRPPAYGSRSQDLGPGNEMVGVFCKKVQNSATKEKNVMDCCHDKANSGPWIPIFNDCHKSVKRCLAENGLSDPGEPYQLPTYIPPVAPPGRGCSLCPVNYPSHY